MGRTPWSARGPPGPPPPPISFSPPRPPGRAAAAPGGAPPPPVLPPPRGGAGGAAGRGPGGPPHVHQRRCFSTARTPRGTILRDNQSDRRSMSISEGKLRHMTALSNKNGIIAAAAMDQRGSLQKAIAAGKGISTGQVTPEMMTEFKVAVSKILTPHASAILLDPEFGLPAAKARSKNAGLLLAYEETGYDNTQPGRLPDLLPHVSAKRIVDWGADEVKILIY